MTPFEQALAVLERLHDQTPAWISAPVGVLRISPWVATDQVFVLVDPEILVETAGEPVVLISQQAYDAIRRIEGLSHADRPPILQSRLTDKQIAGFFVEKARNRWLER